ncbi:MAG: hypothetical protein HYY16_01365 [Planctomycetes bacterium]|nr:hypothetical protein [Planctomycetota bacterium]
MADKNPQKLTEQGANEYRRVHLPYVVGVMRGHKKLCDRGPYTGDVDILNAAFVGSVMAGRMLLQFMGIGLDRERDKLRRCAFETDDVSTEDIDKKLADIDSLNADASRRDLLVGFIRMAHKAGAHMTIPDKRPWERTHEAFQEIERLLAVSLRDVSIKP